METKLVATQSLKEYPGNPRKGDIDAIAESLKVNGQYKPIVVQKDTNLVLAGNHTLKAAVKLGWSFIDVVEVDVDNEGARRIVLADNRTSDSASYDYTLLAEMLKGMADFEGTGYDASALATLIDEVSGIIPEFQTNERESNGLGTPIIHYDIIFDTEEQQTTWYDYMKWLRLTMPDAPTNAARLISHIRKVMV